MNFSQHQHVYNSDAREKKKAGNRETGVGSGNDLGSRDRESGISNEKIFGSFAPKILIFCTAGVDILHRRRKY